jgi:hypothetical protein
VVDGRSAAASKLLETPNFRYAAFNLALSYFEGWEQYHSGQDSRGKSEKFFIRGVKAVFPERRTPSGWPWR